MNPYDAPRSPVNPRAISDSGYHCPKCNVATSFLSNFVQIIPNRFKCNACKAKLKHHNADVWYYLIFFPPAVPLLFMERGPLFWAYTAGYLIVFMLIYWRMIIHLRRKSRLCTV